MEILPTDSPAAGIPGVQTKTNSGTLPPSNKLRKIGIHGARGTGKTCFLGCLYGKRSTEHAAVTFSDDNSINRLKDVWTVLKQTDRPMDATALTRPAELHMGIQVDGIGWDISTCDYAGALVQRDDRGMPELKEKVKKWLKSCHGILLFINIDARTDVDDSVIKDRHDELDLLLTELKRLSPTGNTISRPLALLLTKWDVQGKISNDIERERERAKEYLRSRPALKQIADTLENSGDRVELFPVSAFGANRNGNTPPAGGPRPFGLHEPLAWIVQKIDEVLLERAKRKAEDLAGVAKYLWNRRYGKAAQCFDDLIQKEGVNKGPVYEVARQESANLWRKHFKKVVVVITLSLLVGFGAAFGALYWHAKSMFEKTQAILADHSVKPEQVKQQCEDYFAGWNPLSSWFGHEKSIADEWKKYQEQRETQEYEELKEFRGRNNSPAQARHCVSQEDLFLTRWPSSSYRAEVEGWQKEDSARAKEHDVHTQLETEYWTLLENLSKTGADYSVQMELCDGFLKKFPRTKFANGQTWITDIQARRDNIEKAKHEQEWAKVVNFEQQHPQNFDQILEHGRDYLNKPAARYHKEAKELIFRTEIRWDKREYDNVRTAVKEATDTNSIEAAVGAARRYLGGTHPRKRCENEVKTWLRWFEGFNERKDYYIIVRKLSIPDNSRLADKSGGEQTRVFVRINDTINEREYSTHSDKEEWPTGRNPNIGRTVGPFPLKWGEKGTLVVRVEEYDWPDGNDWAENSANDDLFVLRKAHGLFIARCGGGKDVSIYLECPAIMEQPLLPPYPDK